jgi:hypothetical protein
MDIKKQDVEDLSNPGVPFPEVDLAPSHMHTFNESNILTDDPIHILLSETFMKEVNRVREEAYSWQEWALQEILHWKQRCDELELENMLLQEDFERERKFNLEDIKPKTTGGVFNAH